MSHDTLLAGGTHVCAVSTSPKWDPARNEDAGVTLWVPRAGLRGVALADGVGGYSRAGEAARFVARVAASGLRGEREFGRGTLARVFGDAHARLRSYARQEAGGEPEPRAFGSTLLMGLDTGADIVAAYAGNGAIWHIRGNFDEFPSSGLPWNAVNLLNPHAVLRDGRGVPHNILDAASERAPSPTVLSVSKDAEFGDIFLFCTDGVHSADGAMYGTDANGGVWLSVEAPMVAFHQALRELFADWDGVADLPLRAALTGCLEGLRSQGMLAGDATMGVIVTASVLHYQRRARAARAALAKQQTARRARPIAVPIP